VYTDHPDLQNNIWINTDEIPGNGIDDDNNGYVDDWQGWDFFNENNDPNPDPDGLDNDYFNGRDDQVTHGTIVSGVAGAIGNEGYGTAGVSWKSKIMALQVFPDDGGTYVSVVVEGMDYAVDNGADIINLSIGSSYEQSFNAPIYRAYRAGVAVICAAGNDRKAMSDDANSWVSPTCNDGPNPTDNYVLGVAAVDPYDRLASYSNYDTSSRNFVDVCAPGTGIYGPSYYNPDYSYLNSYFSGNNVGTSFSCPQVSGLAALVLAQHPEYGPAQVYDTIRNNADDIDILNPGRAGQLGTGRINCGRTLGKLAAPAAVSNFQAFDTPGDDGGSITLTWTRSSDDGGGANSLTAYQILRRQGEAGTFEQIAELPPGTETYVDTDVSDGQVYYYKVRCTDDALTSETDASAGVSPLNDSSPAPVDDLSALDRGNDDGGAVVLNWPTYTPPADFASYRIYRNRRDFSSTTDIPVIATLTNPATSTYVDATTQDGVDYYYAVGVRDTASNEERTIRATGPVQSYPNNNISFGPGLLFLGPAAVPPDRDPATLLNIPPANLKAARWDPTAQAYVTYSPGNVPELLRLALGRGFWARLDQAVVIQPSGTSAPAGDFSIELTPGWHQLANPFFGPLDFGASTVTYNSNTMDLASAENADIMGAFAWTYSTADGEYSLAYPDLSQGSNMVPPWVGFWVNVMKQCVLTLARPVGVAASSATETPRAETVWQQGWHAQVVLQAAGCVDAQNYVGTALADYAIPSPPPIVSRPQLYLSAANRDDSSIAPYAVSLGAATANKWVWNLDVCNIQAGTEVQISLPDLSAVPSSYTVTLYDPLAAATTYLRTATGYRFTARSEQTRRLQLTVQEKTAGALMIGTMNAQPTAGGAAQIVFSLSQSAETTVEILNIAGRCVSKVEQQHLRSAGNHTILFDGRNSYGAPIPAGRYLVAVTAQADNGQQVRRVAPVILNR